MAISVVPAGRKALSNLDRRRAEAADVKRLSELGSREDIFLHHFLANDWRNGESVSGLGSTLRYTDKVRKEMPELCAELKARRLLDAPCGDFQLYQARSL